MSGEDRWLGHYRLIKLLGQGGMGQVWRAEDTHMGREIALKVLPVELADDAEYRKRFEREARLAARLRGPHVVPIHTFGERDGRLFIDMELVDGVDLGKVLATFGPLTPARAVDLIGQVAEALDTAHAAGLVHRDVKPSNVVTLQNGYAYLIDFGIARGTGQATLTATGVALGTWAYMAPERLSGGEDHRSDVYSLACMLYQCLTGSLPFTVTDPVQQLAAHLNNEPPRASSRTPGLPVTLDAVIARGMAKDPNHRYDSAGALAAAARAAMQSPLARPHTPPTAMPVANRDGGGRMVRHGGAAQIPGAGATPPPHAQAVPRPHTPPTPQPHVQATPPHPGSPHAAFTPSPPHPGGVARPMPTRHSGGTPRPMPTRYSGEMSHGLPAAVPQPRPRRSGPWRWVWWVVLMLLLALFGMLTIATVAVTFSNGFGGVGPTILAWVIFVGPFAGVIYLTTNEVKRFRDSPR